MTSIYLLLAAGALLSLFFFRGARENRRRAAWFASILENAFSPEEKEYVNIGGVIGYQLIYKNPLAEKKKNSGKKTKTGNELKKKSEGSVKKSKNLLKEMKGTIVLAPRHSLLYLPLALFLGRMDRVYINFFPHKKISAEAHLLTASHYKKMKNKICCSEKLEKSQHQHAEKEMVILSENGKSEKLFSSLMKSLTYPGEIFHFSQYPPGNNFHLHWQGRKENFETSLGEILAFLKRYS